MAAASPGLREFERFDTPDGFDGPACAAAIAAKFDIAPESLTSVEQLADWQEAIAALPTILQQLQTPDSAEEKRSDSSGFSVRHFKLSLLGTVVEVTEWASRTIETFKIRCMKEQALRGMLRLSLHGDAVDDKAMVGDFPSGTSFDCVLDEIVELKLQNQSPPIGFDLDDAAKVTFVFPQGHAYKQGVKPGDQLVDVNGRLIRGCVRQEIMCSLLLARPLVARFCRPFVATKPPVAGRPMLLKLIEPQSAPTNAAPTIHADLPTSSNGAGSGVRVTVDFQNGSNVPTVRVTRGGDGYVVGEVLVVDASSFSTLDGGESNDCLVIKLAAEDLRPRATWYRARAAVSISLQPAPGAGYGGSLEQGERFEASSPDDGNAPNWLKLSDERGWVQYGPHLEQLQPQSAEL
mmetsp:Transcript_83811/g.191304  ORF Transcript_83811/g.191304 Transcript_83811/m.191304 type:complete len:405 (+) Transcript_83811:33-1247(+)